MLPPPPELVNQMRRNRSLPTLVALALTGISHADAAVITGISARASSEFTGRPAVAAIDGSGLTGDEHNTDFAQMWLSANADTTGTFEVDLGAVYDLSSLKIWNYNESNFTSRGIMAANIDVATTFGNYTTQAADRAFAIAPGAPGDFSETIDLSGTTARYVRLDISANHGDAGFTGISELQFDGAIVPGQEFPIPITGVTATSELAGREAIYATDGSGLFGPTHTVAPGMNMWLSDQVADADIIFDLGSSQLLGSIKVWNYNETLPGREAELLSRGINEVDIQTSDDGATFTTVKTHNFALAPGNNTEDFSENVPLEVTARFVKLDVKSNHGNTENWTGISEVQFFPPSTDADADDLPDSWEEQFFPGDLTQLTGLKSGPGPGADTGDFDGDGVSDSHEHQMGLLPNDDDTDDDTLLDGAEIAGAGSRPPTNPKSDDTDGDSIGDLAETNTGTFVNIGDTGTDPTQVDSDGDTFSDHSEIAGHTDPNDTADFPLATLVGYWPFDADVDPQPDLSGFGNNATVDGAATWADDATRNSGVMQFVSGVGLQAAHSDSLSIAGPITIAAWVKPAAGAWEGIVAKGPTGAMLNFPGNYELRVHETNRHLEMLWEPTPDGFAAITDLGNPVSDNVWTHVAFAGTPGGLYTFYIDGAATSSGNMPDNFGGQNTSPLYIGSRADALTGFDGCLDDVAVFRRPAPATADPRHHEWQLQRLRHRRGRFPDHVDHERRDAGGQCARPVRHPSLQLPPGALLQGRILDLAQKPQRPPGGWIELDDAFNSQGESTTYVDVQAAGAGLRIFYRVSEN